MAYSHPDQLKLLITALDDERNDIFVHIDADSNFPMDSIDCVAKSAHCYITDRISVKWGDYSQVEAELILLKTALQNGCYRYYHLLSGMDFPIKTQNEIHAFFENKDEEFIGTVPYEGRYQLEHVKYWYPLLRLKCFRSSKCLKALNQLVLLLQKMLRVNRIKQMEIHFYDGWTWFSITDAFARFVLERESSILNLFQGTKAPDEMVLQTVAMNSSFQNKLYNLENLREGSMRMIDWKRGDPYVWKEKDFEELMHSPCLFARKLDFSEESSRIMTY